MEKDYFVGIDKADKHAYMFSYNDINKTVFMKRKTALDIVNEALKNRRKDLSDKKYYEEY